MDAPEAAEPGALERVAGPQVDRFGGRIETSLTAHRPRRQSTALDWALGYAEIDMAVFPVWPGEGKNPLTKNGFKNASTDEATIRAWWQRWPHADIAWAVPPEKIVVDLDEKNGFHGIRDFLRREGVHPRDMATPMGTTPSGGLHLIFDTGGERFKNIPIEGGAIDLKTAGGYVVLPGEANGRRWLKNLTHPLALVPAWVPRAPVFEPHEAGEASEFKGATIYSTAALRRAVAAIVSAPCGKQESTLNKEVFCIGTLVGAGQLDREAALKALLSAADAMTAHTTPWGPLEPKVTRIFEQGRQKPRKLKGDQS
jgi:hypothetical protein